MDKRLKFAEKNRRRDWTHVMFSDRKRFHFRYPGQSVSAARWEMEGAEQGGGEVWSPNNPNSFNVYGGITVHGVTRLHEVAQAASQSLELLREKRLEISQLMSTVTCWSRRSYLGGKLPLECSGSFSRMETQLMAMQSMYSIAGTQHAGQGCPCLKNGLGTALI